MGNFPQQGAIYLAQALQQAGDTLERPCLCGCPQSLCFYRFHRYCCIRGKSLSHFYSCWHRWIERDSVAMSDLISIGQKSYVAFSKTLTLALSQKENFSSA